MEFNPEQKNDFLIESHPIFEAGRKIGVREEKRDFLGHLVEEIWRDSEGRETDKAVYIADASGIVIKEEWFKGGVLEGSYLYKYDENGKYLGKDWKENSQ